MITSLPLLCWRIFSNILALLRLRNSLFSVRQDARAAEKQRCSLIWRSTFVRNINGSPYIFAAGRADFIKLLHHTGNPLPA